MNLISFLGKRFKRFFSSGQKVPTSKFRWLILMGVLCFVPWQEAEAKCSSYGNVECWKKCYNDVYWDAESGCIHYKVRYWQNWGSDAYEDWSGFRKDEGGLEIVQNTTPNKSWKIKCKEGGSIDTNGPKGSDETDAGTNYTEKYIVWDSPISSNDLNNTITISFDGLWWRYGTSTSSQTDCNVDDDYTVNTKASVGSYVIKKQPYYSYENNNPAVSVEWKWDKSNANVTKADECGLWYNNQIQSDLNSSSKGYKVEENNTEGVFYFVADNDFLKKSHKFYLHRKYKPKSNNNIYYEANSEEVVIKAFAQVENLSVEPDVKTKQLHIMFDVPTVSGDQYEDCPFLVKINGSNGVDTVIVVNYSSNSKQYKLDYDLGVVDGITYKVRVAREKTFDIQGWDKYILESKVTVSTSHYYPDNVKADTSKTKDGENCIVVSWDQIGSIWTEGTQMVINRTNLTTASTSKFDISEKQFHEGKYQDILIQQCNNYVYDIEFTPGGNYPTKTFNIDKKISFVSIGSLEDLSVSKGYFSDKVDLGWKSNSEFDEFVVERRENDNPSSKFTKIQSIGGLNISDYALEDRSCQPGVMYAYRVYGLKKCSEDVYQSKDTLYVYGFRTPTGNLYGRVAF
ncbi:MAG: hypothetical protein J6S93_06110 [Paludibacteraceae bacterium]|nr:hypothetical protein [Paludibacteraceae bacterium]